ncbi:MAG: response regulator [Spirochaetes bacterium]|nr:response regulator [Spirochaetota bacterium]MBN2770135.1 response regulator [Spirochaetota bacterium]
MKRVLVIEDNDANLYLISYILMSNGIDVISCKEGLPGVETALVEQPDLIVMDIQLPDINGLEATQRIRNDERGKDLVIVALTSYAMTGDREKALAAGCTGYMEKPINPEKFIGEINSYLEIEKNY